MPPVTNAIVEKEQLATSSTSRFAREWLHEVATIAESFNTAAIAQMATMLRNTREAGGRLFVLGVGGSASNASHAVCDFRRIGGLEAYAPADNLAEFSALTNDLDWRASFWVWLNESHLNERDSVLILSVSGGSSTQSQNLVDAAVFANRRGASVLAIVGRREALVIPHADAWLVVPCPNDAHRTPHAEAFQGVLTHLLATELAQ